MFPQEDEEYQNKNDEEMVEENLRVLDKITDDDLDY